MSGTEQRDWSDYADFGSLLGAVMEERGFGSDKELATAARKYKPYNNLSDGKTINNWRNGIGPGRSRDSRAMVNQVRKALAVPDAVSPLGRAWDMRLGEVYAKPSQSKPPPVDNPDILDVKLVKSPGTDSDVLEGSELSDDKSSANPVGGWLLFKLNVAKALSTGFSAHLTRKSVFAGAAIAVLAVSLSIWLFRANPVDGKSTLEQRDLPYNELHLNSSGFVIPSSSVGPVTEDMLQGLTGWDLYVARNELFARHGRIFDTACLDTHFRKYARNAPTKGWYEPKSPSIGPSDLSDLEGKNHDNIRAYEKKTFGRLYACKKD